MYETRPWVRIWHAVGVGTTLYPASSSMPVGLNKGKQTLITTESNSPTSCDACSKAFHLLLIKLQANGRVSRVVWMGVRISVNMSFLVSVMGTFVQKMTRQNPGTDPAISYHQLK